MDSFTQTPVNSFSLVSSIKESVVKFTNITSNHLMTLKNRIKNLKYRRKSHNYAMRYIKQKLFIFLIPRAIFPTFNVHCTQNALGQVTVEGWFTSHELLGISHRHSPYLIQGSTLEKMEEVCKPQALVELREIRDHIAEGLKAGDLRVREKWQFIADKYDAFLASCPCASDLVSMRL